MSMSTQHEGGNRKPSTRPVVGAKPKQGGDEVETSEALELDPSLDPSDAPEVDAPEGAAEKVDAPEGAAAEGAAEKVDAPEGAAAEGAAEKVAAAEGAAEKPRAKANSRKPAPAKKGARPGTGSSSKAAPGKARPGKAGTRPGAKAGSRRIAPVKVNQGRNWGPIALFTAVLVIAGGIIGFAGWQVYENGLTWQERADRIDGLVNYNKTDPKSLEYTSHTFGPIKYKYSPPVGGTHNQNWQRCLGDVYPEAIASEHAVHSMEHGAVWITYNPSLPANQVETLAKKVRGQDYLLMSPYPGLDKPISLQTWGYQLKVDNANDKRIDEFVKVLKQKAAKEQGATCSSGAMITETGTTPRDLGRDQPQQPGG